MKRLFLAGATGAIGTRLIPLLLAAGYDVHGLTRSADKAEGLAKLGVHPTVGNVYDSAALDAALRASRPDVVVHQLTDLPQRIESGLSAADQERNARIRIEGTQNLVRAALTAGVRRLVAQSLIASYADGPEPHRESDPLDVQTRGSVIALERLALESPPSIGCVLRFGRFYGPGTWYAHADGSSPVHVDAAAYATLLAIERYATGAFNVAEDRGYATSERARTELGWDPAYRLPSSA
jgi:nucleoside-diphosphate-sugar epimerase